MLITQDDFDTIDSNSTGTPRHVVHFLALIRDLPAGDISNKYRLALWRSRVAGGKKYHNKQYGGGIAFATWNLQKTIDKLNAEIYPTDKEE